ncbi:hypothetical protein [Nocardia salmonicida]
MDEALVAMVQHGERSDLIERVECQPPVVLSYINLGGTVVDPITVITTALIAGAAAGGTDAASAAVRDTYIALRNRISRVAADPETSAAIAANEAAPGSNRADIEAALSRDHLMDDTQLRTFAVALLSRLPASGMDTTFVKDSYGVQVGNENSLTMNFGNNPNSHGS